MTDHDLKPRSRDVTDGLEKTAARGMLRAVGLGDDDFAKPQIGVASSWNEITPCNLSLPASRSRPRKACTPAGGFPLEFGTISVSDGISMGHVGMHFSLVSREIIADSVETVMRRRAARRLGAAGRLRQVAARDAHGGRAARPRIGLPLRRLDAARHRAGCPTAPTARSPSSTPSRRSAPARAGLSRERTSTPSSGRSVPVEGACGGMYTANTMASAAEALGMSLPGSAAPPAVDRRRDGYARASGEAVVELLRQGITARQIMTQAGVRERHRGRHGARRLDQRGAAPAGDRARGRGRPAASTTSTGSAHGCRTSPTSSRSVATS